MVEERWFEVIPSALNDTQKLLLARGALRLARRTWFGTTMGPPPDHHMVSLLLAVYTYAALRIPLYKKTAWMETGTDDIKTARKYIARAEELGLVQAVRSTSDKRRVLLFPTPRFANMMDIEVRSFAIEIQRLTIELRDTHHSPTKAGSVAARPRTRKAK